MKSKQGGFTLFELLTLIMLLVIFCGGGITLYVAVHFISKFWYKLKHAAHRPNE
jgi:hypothetical protein